MAYINSKEVVVDKDLANMDNISRNEIEGAINYLPTEPTWDFKPEDRKPRLNINASSVHVPTNIYDKCKYVHPLPHPHKKARYWLEKLACLIISTHMDIGMSKRDLTAISLTLNHAPISLSGYRP